jgi:hypothetical protein
VTTDLCFAVFVSLPNVNVNLYITTSLKFLGTLLKA